MNLWLRRPKIPWGHADAVSDKISNVIDVWYFQLNDSCVIKKTLPQSSIPDGIRSGGLKSPSSSRIPLSMIQKTAAKRMLLSAQEVPQFSISRELDADELASLRSRINTGVEVKEERVSFTALLIYLTAKALLKHPRVNGQFDGDAIIQYDFVNMAVAMDTPQGLTVPVIHGVNSLSVYEIAKALKELIGRATRGRLAIKDFAKATFTMSNLGMLGVGRFTPLINPPQAAIMGVGAPRDSVRRDSGGGLVPFKVIEVTVAGDHRVLDGAEVARFLQTLQDRVKDVVAMEDLKPSRLMLTGIEEKK